MILNIFDVLEEKNLNKEYIMLNIDTQVKVSKDIDGSLFLESSNQDISKIWPVEDIWMEEFIEVDKKEKQYA